MPINENHLRQKEKAYPYREKIFPCFWRTKIIVEDFKAKIGTQNHYKRGLQKEAVTRRHLVPPHY
jgi:hypothetical protein